MPSLDVGDAWGIENVDSFSVTSTVMTVNEHGVASGQTTFSDPVYGIVIPVKASTLRRLGDGSRLAASIDIYTKFPLTEGFKANDMVSREADIVTWDGWSFTVASIENFTGFGAGYLHAQCDLLPLNPTTQEPQPGR